MASLQLVDVVKHYGSTVALDTYSLTVPEGRVTAFVGSNGAGKSTAMRVLGGLREPDLGTVLFRGRPLTSDDRNVIGHMPEERGLYVDEPVQVQLRYFASILGMSARAAAADVDAVLERVGVAELAHLPFGSLSLGNRQRAQLALALLGSPRFLLLDEPFSGLDVDGLSQVSELVRDLAADGVGVLVSSHQLETVAAISDRVAVISGGRSVMEGDLATIVGTAKRSLRLMYRVGGRTETSAGAPSHAVESVVQTFARRVGGSYDVRAGAMHVEIPIAAGEDLDDAILASAVGLGPLTSVEVTQPSLRELLAGQR